MTAPSASGSIATSSARRTIETYGSAGVRILADIYEARAPLSGWVVVVCPGYGSIRGLMTGWGETLAADGHHTCVVGYRGYGETPDAVGRIFPDEHVDDVRSVVRWAASQFGAHSRVAVLGVSYGGGIAVAVGAQEPKVKAVVSIVGYGSGSRHLRSLRRYTEWLDLLELIEADQASRVTNGMSETVTLDEILLRDARSQSWREQVESEHPEMRFPTTLESVEKLIEFEPERHLPFDRALPLLVLHAGNDRVIPVEEAHILHELAGQPKKLVILEGAEHHDVHTGETFRRVTGEVEEFLAGIP